MSFHDPVTPTNPLAGPSGSTQLTPFASALSLSQATGMSSEGNRNEKLAKPMVYQTTGMKPLRLRTSVNLCRREAAGFGECEFDAGAW